MESCGEEGVKRDGRGGASPPDHHATVQRNEDEDGDEDDDEDGDEEDDEDDGGDGGGGDDERHEGAMKVKRSELIAEAGTPQPQCAAGFFCLKGCCKGQHGTVPPRELMLRLQVMRVIEGILLHIKGGRWLMRGGSCTSCFDTICSATMSSTS